MTTTTIRVDKATHDQLLDLSAAAGTSLVETVRQAAEALRRQRFGRRVAGEVDVLRQDAVAWQAYLAETDLAVNDGID